MANPLSISSLCAKSLLIVYERTLSLCRSSTVTATIDAVPNLKSPAKPSPPKSNKKTTRYKGLNIVWKCTGSTNNSPHSRAEWTSAMTSPPAATSCIAQILITTAGVDQGVLPEREVMSLPEQAAKLLPWYMQWSRDLVDEMHRRCLVRDKACRTNPSPCSFYDCGCTSEWQCKPHDACFIHDSCFCPGSGSFPPVKPPCT